LLSAALLGAATSAPAAASSVVTPNVSQSATPAGWLAVDFGDAQISVPAGWSEVQDGASSCGPATGVVILGSGQWCPQRSHEAPGPGTSTVTVEAWSSGSAPAGPPSAVVNGIPVYASGAGRADVAPALHAKLVSSGPPQPEVLRSLTFSPRAVVLAPGRPSPVPRGWRWIGFAGLRFAVPASWPVSRPVHAPPCGTDVVLPVAGVTLDREPPIPLPCPLPAALVRPVARTAGIEVDGFEAPGSSLPSGTACVGPRTVNGLPVCIDATPPYALLEAQVTTSVGHWVTVDIGLTGGGTTARAVLESIRRS
jgi:hypothetical protein